jgi:hypothetical protein
MDFNENKSKPSADILKAVKEDIISDENKMFPPLTKKPNLTVSTMRLIRIYARY